MVVFQKEQIQQILPNAKDSNITLYLDSLNTTLVEFTINTPERACAFIAQIGEESENLVFVEEDLNYSAEALLKVFPKYFSNGGIADLYARKPVSIANKVYANRMGNGDESSGDGYRYRGRGLIQITGKWTYAEFTMYDNKASNPDYLKTPQGACRSAGWFWNKNKLNDLADQGDIKGITYHINGGYNGLQNRIDNYNGAMNILKG